MERPDWLGSNLPLLVDGQTGSRTPSPINNWIFWRGGQPADFVFALYFLPWQFRGKVKTIELNFEEYDGDILDLTKDGIWHDLLM